MFSDWSACGPQLVAAAEWAAKSAHHPACPIARGRDIETIDKNPCTCHVKAAKDALSRYKRATEPSGSLEFLRARFGKNWVLARRTTNIVARYGSDVVCLSKKQYLQAETDYLDGKPAHTDSHAHRVGL